MVKLTEEQELEIIVDAYFHRGTFKEIGQRFGVSAARVGAIVQRDCDLRRRMFSKKGLKPGERPSPLVAYLALVIFGENPKDWPRTT